MQAFLGFHSRWSWESLETSEEVAAPTSSPAHLAGFGLWEGKNFGSSVQHGPFFKLAFLARAKLAE